MALSPQPEILKSHQQTSLGLEQFSDLASHEVDLASYGLMFLELDFKDTYYSNSNTGTTCIYMYIHMVVYIYILMAKYI